jgi:hypothetical protein
MAKSIGTKKSATKTPLIHDLNAQRQAHVQIENLKCIPLKSEGPDFKSGDKSKNAIVDFFQEKEAMFFRNLRLSIQHYLCLIF